MRDGPKNLMIDEGWNNVLWEKMFIFDKFIDGETIMVDLTWLSYGNEWGAHTSNVSIV